MTRLGSLFIWSAMAAPENAVVKVPSEALSAKVVQVTTEGDELGTRLGTPESALDSTGIEGEDDGTFEGIALGTSLGLTVGDTLGATDGFVDGELDAKAVGDIVGGGDGPNTGFEVGDEDGDAVGVADDEDEVELGVADGFADGEVLGTSVSIAEGESLRTELPTPMSFTSENGYGKLNGTAKFGSLSASLDIRLAMSKNWVGPFKYMDTPTMSR